MKGDAKQHEESQSQDNDETPPAADGCRWRTHPLDGYFLGACVENNQLTPFAGADLERYRPKKTGKHVANGADRQVWTV